MARRPKSPKSHRRPGVVGRLFRWLALGALIFGLVGPVAVVTLYRFVPPPITWLMVERMVQGHGFDRR